VLNLLNHAAHKEVTDEILRHTDTYPDMCVVEQERGML
jgi:hypothetical protein